MTSRTLRFSGAIWNAVRAASQQWQDGAYPSRITHDGLEEVEWDQIEPGDEVVVHYLEDGRIVRIASFTALTPCDSSKSGMPIEAEYLSEIQCCRG